MAKKITHLSQMTTEHYEQVALVVWLRVMGIGVMSVPNGVYLGGRNRGATMAKLKNEGLLTGAPDLVLFRRTLSGKPVAVEMKHPESGTVSPEQLSVHMKMEEAGWAVIVAYGAPDAVSQLRKVYGL